MVAKHTKHNEFTETTADFAGHVDDMQFVNREPVFAFNAKPIEIPHEFRNTTAYVGPMTKQAIQVNSPSACKSILNALVDLHDGTQFAVVEEGLHLRCPLEDLQAIPYHQNIGVLGAGYKGTDARFLKLVPEQGWVRLGVNFGTLTARPIVFIEGMKDEAEYVRHDRKSVMLHGAIDSLLKGFCYHISPVFFVGDGEPNPERKPLVEQQAAFIKKYKEVMEMSPEERRVSYQQNVLQLQERRAYGKVASGIAKAIEAGEEPVAIESITLIDGTTATFADLNGKVVRKWYGRVAIAGAPVISEDNWATFAAVVKARGYKVEVVGLPTA